MKKVSIIIPAYKCATFIGKTLDMLLLQTYQNKEIIVVNDGSPDDLSKVLEKYKERVKIINKKNGGVASARNRGLEEATGDYIAFIDADDRIDIDTIERSVKLLEDCNADIVRYNIVREYPDGTLRKYDKISDKRLIINKNEYKEKVYIQMIRGISFNSPTGIYKRDIIGNIRFDEDMLTCEDATFNLFVFTKSQCMVYDPDIVYYYYQGGEGLTGRGISIKEKYRCNYKYGKYMLGLLEDWGMNTLYYKLKIYMRLVNITIAKLIRKK